MNMAINIKPEMIEWAIARSGKSIEQVLDKDSNVGLWLRGEKLPTFKQLEKFASSVFTPVGYFFLSSPPEETINFPFFRNNKGITHKVSVNVQDTITLVEERQEWMRDFLRENAVEELEFVGKFGLENTPIEVADAIRKTLGFEQGWASGFSTKDEAFAQFIKRTEDAGIFTVIAGIVGNNTRRKIPLEECRGFVLVDKLAPFVFINGSDWKSAQIFTLAHELAHIWIGESAGFDLAEYHPYENAVERFCDKVAANLLAPEDLFRKLWKETQDFEKLAKEFKVSTIVIARRAFDLSLIPGKAVSDLVKQFQLADKTKKGAGGNFYLSANYRVGRLFASQVKSAVKSGELLYRDAYRLTGLSGNTFER